MGEVERMANAPLPVAQRAPRIAALESELDELLRVEEALVADAIAVGRARAPLAVSTARGCGRSPGLKQRWRQYDRRYPHKSGPPLRVGRKGAEAWVSLTSAASRISILL
jgi:hypothetical protein